MNLKCDREMKHSTKNLLSRILASALFFIIAGCSSASYLVQTSWTAGVAGHQPIRVYLVEVNGTAQDAFRKELVDLFSENGHFIVSPYGTQPSSLDTNSPQPAIIVSGHHETREETRTYTTGEGKDEKNYRETNDLNSFEYEVRDAAKGEMLDAGVVTHSDVYTEENPNTSFFGSLVNSVVKSTAEALVGIESARRKGTIKSFIDRLVVHREYRFIELIRDGELPGLNDAVAVAMKGNWEGAVKKLQEVTENDSNHVSLHKVYYDLGIAYECSGLFERALVSLRVAQELSPLQKYQDELEWCEQRVMLIEWQERYAGVSQP